MGDHNNKRKTDLIVGKSSVLVDGVDSGHARTDGFALQHCLLLTLGKQRDVVVDVFQDNVHGGLAGQLLDAVVLDETKSHATKV